MNKTTSAELCPSYDEMRRRFESKARHHLRMARKATDRMDAVRNFNDALAYREVARNMAAKHRAQFKRLLLIQVTSIVHIPDAHRAAV